MNFYLFAVDDLMRKPAQNPTIGILICKRNENFIAEYAIGDIHKPMRVNIPAKSILPCEVPKEILKACSKSLFQCMLRLLVGL